MRILLYILHATGGLRLMTDSFTVMGEEEETRREDLGGVRGYFIILPKGSILRRQK